MKKSLIVGITLTTLLFSCGQKKVQTNDAEMEEQTSAEMEEQTSAKMEEQTSAKMEEKVLEYISFQVEHIPAEFQVEQTESAEKNFLTKPIPKQTLGLPGDFINRDFLTNSVGYKDRLEYLVGMVVKKEKIDGVDRYTVVLDSKKDSSRVSARVPAQGVLIEKKYDQEVGAGIQYLITSAEMERNSAFQIFIVDVSEITIADNSINKLALYNTYNGDSEIDKYFIIRAAVTTSILYKKFTKMSAKTEFNAAAIKVGANYYSESSDLKQDWKIGLQLTPVKEFLKGFKPKN